MIKLGISYLMYYCNKKRIFVLQKFVKRTEKIICFLSAFVCFHFTEIYFLNFPWNENVRKQHLSANAYFCVNMKFSYTLTGLKDKILFVVLYRKQKIFHQRLGQLFVNNFLSHYSNNKPLDNFSLRCLFFSDILQQTWSKNRRSLFISFMIIKARPL